MARRTVRKLTCWAPEEWARVEALARARGVPPLRYVREAVLAQDGKGAASLRRRRRRRPSDELVHQLARVLNNVRQLHRVAEYEGDEAAAGVLAGAVKHTEKAIAAAPESARDAAPLAAEVRATGVALNEVVHRANTHECLPDGWIDAMCAAMLAVRRCLS